MKGATTEDWMFLINLQFEQKTKVFDLASMSIVDGLGTSSSSTSSNTASHSSAAPCSTTLCVPWPVQWLCCKFNRKHILHTKKSVSIEAIVDHVSNWEDKLRWRVALRGNPSSTLLVKNKMKNMPLNKLAADRRDPGLETFFSHTRRAIIKLWKNAMTRHSTFCIGSVPLVYWAMEIVRERRWHLVPNDKEPGWTIHNNHDMMSVYDSILKLPTYFPEGNEFIAMELLTREVQGFASAIGKIESDRRWTSLIMKSWNRP